MRIFLPPPKIYNSIREWSAEVSEDTLLDKNLKIIYPPSTFLKKINRPPARYPNRLQEGYVAIIPNGRVWGLNGAIITQDNSLLWDVSLEMVNPHTNHSIFKEKTLPIISDYYKKVADLTHVVGGNYYHWMYEVISRVHLIEQSGIEVNRFIVKSEPNDLSFQAETLQHIGVELDKIIKTDNHFHIQAENLIVPSQPSFATKWAYDYLRKTFLVQSNNFDRIRLYISRKWYRRILNEDELMDVLKDYGFVKMELEKVSVAEQVRLFSAAEVIIAPHGAGLTNLTFCQLDTKVVEIFPPTYITSLYWVISSFGHLQYFYYIGQLGEPDPAFAGQDWSGFDNLKIDIPRFIRLLKKVI
ncbi:hypothetical protein AM500_24275 [Bacillus sp. FJAT-18017]|uniref:glycosyltransferase family 61 protein n=1 Tax=Bacillus sp. FJAT-18017 TaxID=1705566 RepID=UPI0006AE9644|nr:glycosyltransferase family 61 protein [Bacillus sp. FJAT-18017]ALC92529.1 hypothetical protein AM500_24275 [Bacillus sp. FJAT-18017]